MNEQIPDRKEYSSPHSLSLLCTFGDCYYAGKGVRQLKKELRGKYREKFAYLCPECFKKIILNKGKEKVNFT